MSTTGMDMMANAAKSMGMAGGRSRSRRRSYRGGTAEGSNPANALEKVQAMFKGGRGRSQRRQRTQRRGRSVQRGRSVRRGRSQRRQRSVRRA